MAEKDGGGRERPARPRGSGDRDRRDGPRGRPAGRGPSGMRGGGGEGEGRVWLFGLHAVRDALANPRRRLHRVVLTPNARLRLAEGADQGGPDDPIARHAALVETADPRRFPAPLDPGSVHQGAAVEADPLDWGGIDAVAEAAAETPPPLALALDRVTDPHNVGAILRSAEVFGARAVIAPRRHSAPETGALAKAASGALERQPYLRPVNLGDAIERLRKAGFVAIGLDGEGETDLAGAMAATVGRPRLVVLGAEGPGLRARTRGLCDVVARIPAAGGFASLNVSNAAAVALFAARHLAADGQEKVGPAAQR